VTTLFQSGEGRDAERTNLWAGMNLGKKTEHGTRNNGHELENARRHSVNWSMSADFFASINIRFHQVIKVPNIPRKGGSGAV
jgi:hypothetical protein